MHIFQTTSRRCLLCYVLFVVLSTLMACPQPVGAIPARYSLSHTHSLMQQQRDLSSTVDNPGRSGYMALGNRGTYTKANMFFTVPTLTATQGITTNVAEWVGVGNIYTNPAEVVRVGVTSMIPPKGAQNGAQSNSAWWEITDSNGYPAGATAMDLAMNPGDQIWAYVGSNADGDGYDGFQLTNKRTNQSVTHYEHASGLFSDGSAAECIVADPGGGVAKGQYLAQFQPPISITGCGAYTNGQGGMAPIGSFSTHPINMVYRGVSLAQTSPLINGSDFSVSFKNTGNGAIKSPTSGNPDEVKIVENNEKYAFSPATLTISKGTKVVWTNTSDAPHTVISDDGKFTSSNAANPNPIAKNQTYSFVFNTAGTFKYHCSIHPYMTATITVTSATTPPQ